MSELLPLFVSATAAFFAIMNPIANTPIFLGIAEGLDEKAARRLAMQAIVFAFLTVAPFSVCGNLLLHLFGITVSAFRIAGGLLVALVGYHLLQGRHSPVHKPVQTESAQNADDVSNLAVSPLGMPILAGPGTIVTAMSYADGASAMRIAVVLSAFAAICLVTFICFISGERLTRYLGKNLLMVISRLMGLILAVVGTQMVIEGIRGAIKGAT